MPVAANNIPDDCRAREHSVCCVVLESMVWQSVFAMKLYRVVAMNSDNMIFQNDGERNSRVGFILFSLTLEGKLKKIGICLL